MSLQLERVALSSSQTIPSKGIIIIVTSEEQPSGFGERHGGDTAEDLVISEVVDLGVTAEVEETAGGVIGAGSEGVAIGEEGDAIDIRLVAEVGLGACS